MDDLTELFPYTSGVATYGELFPEQLGNKCSPDALEANDGPLAYLYELYQQVLKLEAQGDASKQVTLADRRPDISELLLDQASLEQSVPALTLVIQALTRQAKQHAGEKTNLAQAIAEANYPASLPFHYPLEQIKAMLRQKKCSLFEVFQQSKYRFPNFCYENLRTDELRQVMRNAAGLSPALQTLLLDNSGNATSGFFLNRSGLADEAWNTLEQLNSIKFFCRLTGLTFEGVVDLLANSGVAEEGVEAVTSVKQSSAYAPAQSGKPTPLAGHLYGAAFLNNATTPVLSLIGMHNGLDIRMRINGASKDHIERINKIIHLQHTLQLPFAEVDLLVMSALRAEGQTKDFHITENTLRALGVFRHLQGEYGVTAEQFSALICGITPYATGESIPFLDRVLDGPGAGQLADINDRLILDGSEFDPDDSADSPARPIISSICRVFALEERVARTYLTQVSSALGLKKPALSLPVFSSLYRLSRLPRLLRLSMSDGVSLIALLAKDNPQVLSQLAGTPRIQDDNETPDILDILIGLVNAEQWLRRQKVPAQVLLAWLTPLPADVPPELKLDAGLRDTLKDALPRLDGSRLTEINIASAMGTHKPAATADTWLSLLGTILDANGLIKAIQLKPGESLGENLTKQLEGKLDSRSHPKEAANILLGLIDNAVIAQEDVAKHIISTAFKQGSESLTPAHALPLLRWVNESRINLLADVLTAAQNDKDNLSGLSIRLWSELNRHAQVIKHLNVSAAGLTALLDHPEWLDLGGKPATPSEDHSLTPSIAPPLSLELCYQLSRYRDWVEKCQLNGFKEDDALDYFRALPNSDQPRAVEAATKRLGSLIGWPAGETLLSVPALLVAKQRSVANAPNTITDIDFILRLQTLCDVTGLSCQSLLNLSVLDEKSTFSNFQTTGQLLLGACNDKDRAEIESDLQERWRDALVAYLMEYWLSSKATLRAIISTTEDLSSYFLADVQVAPMVRTTTATHAITSLQQYLHRLFAHLEPGYENANIAQETQNGWRQNQNEYGKWKRRQSHLNHPVNLIYYANRPDKSIAFQELEVEVNQGKLDTELLQTAITGYLTKFEKTSNLQIISGYLDGNNPKSDTYHFIGKTNASPPEYYWRSLDMGVRDNKQRLNPLAWSEWEKIGIPVSGQIAQSSYTEPGTKNVFKCDAIRPLIIAGRPYVFWVERSTTGLPSADAKNQTPTKYKKLSVSYAYKQSDGFWSPANELMCLDGTRDGKRLPDDDNPYLKDDTYEPGLMALVNTESEREQDPWLTVMLYNCAYASDKGDYGELNKDYFIELRDLLLIEKKSFEGDQKLKDYSDSIFKSYKDTRKIQHAFTEAPIKFLAVDINDISVLRLIKTASASINPSTPQNLTVLVTFDISTLHKDEIGNFFKLIKLERKNPTQTITATNKASFTWQFPATQLQANDILTFTLLGYYTNVKLSLNTSELNTDKEWYVSIKRTSDQAQYLDLNAVANENPTLSSNAVRLNTLFGKQLVARAAQSVERALEWDSQMIKEPTIDTNIPTPAVDFHGANGGYFRELFLHLPALVATRLSESQQFEEAEHWFTRYLFDPYRTQKDEQQRPPFWNTRPLAEVGTGNSELQKGVDPVARAFSLSQPYRQAMFLSLLENWQHQGDHLYRQLTLSSLNQAWLCYQQALRLIGPLPERMSASPWTPAALKRVSASSFRTPVNQRVIIARKTLEARLYTLRHGLTLDGKALPSMDWSGEGGDPFGFATGSVGSLASTYNSDRMQVPAYRFRQLLPMARAAAQQLQDMGRHYMKLMEDEFNTTLSVLLKQQEIRISDFTLRLKKEAISALAAKKRTLELGKTAAQFRNNYYADLIQTGRSPLEEAATGLIWSSAALKSSSMPFQMLVGVTEGVIPNIYGLAVGGNKPSAPMAKTAMVLEIAGEVSKFLSEQLLVESSYERRAQEWGFELKQTEFDIQSIDLELAELSIELNAATVSLDESRQERTNLEEAHVAMTTGFTIIPIYNWLVARQELMYGPAYDAVLSLCLSVEAAWRYELGDYGTNALIKTSAWNDSYKGMLAGESLLLDLQEMENAYLQCNERRLSIKKTIDLKGTLTDAQWLATLQGLAERPLEFELKAADFDKNYPGHYLRQLKHVSVSFVLNPGADATLENVSAILTQTNSTTLVEPSNEGADYLYKQATNAPGSIKRNQRAQQQIALSSSVSDDGLGFGKDDWVYELMFHDGRYLPFEGTGAISRWQLSFPDADFAKSLLTNKNTAALVKTIQLNLVYTAVDGGPAFTKKVKELMKLS